MDVTLDGNGHPLIEGSQAEQLKQRFLEMASVMARLRAECPWDRKQTPQTLKRYVLEEAYEVVSAIEASDWDALCDELGDHMLQVLFLSQIMSETGHFDIARVLQRLMDKMVRRHPHVFADMEADEGQVVANWEAIKKAEKGGGSGLFDGFSRGQPALFESYKIARKAAKVGFDWPEPLQVLDKIEEEIGEIREAASQDREALAEEVGDLLFAMSNLARKFDLEPEECLRKANTKFLKRFATMEQLASDDGQDFADLDLDTQEGYWQRAKQTLKDQQS